MHIGEPNQNRTQILFFFFFFSGKTQIPYLMLPRTKKEKKNIDFKIVVQQFDPMTKTICRRGRWSRAIHSFANTRRHHILYFHCVEHHIEIVNQEDYRRY